MVYFDKLSTGLSSPTLGRGDSVILEFTGSFRLRRQDDDAKGDAGIPQQVRGDNQC